MEVLSVSAATPDRIWGKYPDRIESMSKIFERVRPVVSANDPGHIFKCDLLMHLVVDDPFAKGFGRVHLGERAEKLRIISDITTYHSFWKRDQFIPSVAEIIMQLPKHIFLSVSAFQIIECPRSGVDPNYPERWIRENYHIAKTRLYSSNSTT